MKTTMPNGSREVEIPLPRLLHERLVAAAKAEKRSVGALIVNAVRAEIRASSVQKPQKKLRRSK